MNNKFNLRHLTLLSIGLLIIAFPLYHYCMDPTFEFGLVIYFEFFLIPLFIIVFRNKYHPPTQRAKFVVKSFRQLPSAIPIFDMPAQLNPTTQEITFFTSRFTFISYLLFYIIPIINLLLIIYFFYKLMRIGVAEVLLIIFGIFTLAYFIKIIVIDLRVPYKIKLSPSGEIRTFSILERIHVPVERINCIRLSYRIVGFMGLFTWFFFYNRLPPRFIYLEGTHGGVIRISGLTKGLENFIERLMLLNPTIKFQGNKKRLENCYIK